MTTALLPLLRGLLADDSGLPLLTLDTATDPKAPALELDADAAGVGIEAARQALGRLPPKAAAFTVKGLGTVRIRRDAHGGRAAGKVCLVTGAARGFGLEIATALAREGAFVALADINAEGVEAAVATLNGGMAEPVAMGVTVDVTSPESMRAAVAAIVTRYGGLDVLVSNAGVVKAGSVMEQPLKDFEFVTKVNYTGYFVCVQAVAPVMSLQHQGCPESWFDIIQINSKSGLEGSNKNGAYAGSKFGGIGLTQSFALELVAHGIKVNSICPGNFLDGPLWSDPKNGLFVQYLKSGK
ncbi:MAG: SDR family NAD(P)-dependent oxidoreductase, partial [Kiritimatiellae bacterium]|nr:SDR family NAD(P)-dependent oxidoreductase [Kiritimatiellia bacterium]